MKTLGPFSNYTDFVILNLEADKIKLIKLGYKYAIKHAIHCQIGLFRNQIEVLKKISKHELHSKHIVIDINSDQIQDVYIEKNKYLTHKLIIELSHKKIKLNIDNRDKVKEYNNVIQSWKVKNISQR